MKKPTKKDLIYMIIAIVLVAAVATFAALWAVAAHKIEDGKSYHNRKCAAFEVENSHLSKGQIVFIGDSITDLYPLDDYYADLPLRTYNRGICGDKTSSVLSRLDASLFALEPTKISLLIGINDINTNVSDKELLSNYKKILDSIQSRLPNAEVYCISILPMNSVSAQYKINYQRSTERIPSLNAEIRSLAEGHGYSFVNLYPLFADENNYLIESYSVDGLHLSPEGYTVWTNALKPLLA